MTEPTPRWSFSEEKRQLRKNQLASLPSFAGLVAVAGSLNPIPSRTRPLNSPAPMVLSPKTWKSRSLPGLQRTEFSSSRCSGWSSCLREVLASKTAVAVSRGGCFYLCDVLRNVTPGARLSEAMSAPSPLQSSQKTKRGDSGLPKSPRLNSQRRLRERRPASHHCGFTNRPTRPAAPLT
jgi:hypothetical protein